VGVIRFSSVAAVGCAVAGLLTFADDASARRRTAVASLTRTEGSLEEDASGRLRVRAIRGRRQAVVVKVRRLDPRAEYEIREVAGGALLADLRTNRAGNGRRRLRSDRLPEGVPPVLAGVAIEVIDAETREVVLEGEMPDGPGEGGVREGSAVFESDAGARGVMSVRSDPRIDRDRIVLEVTGLDAAGRFVLFMENDDGVLDDVAVLDRVGGDDDGEDGDGEHEDDGEDGRDGEDGEDADEHEGEDTEEHEESDGHDDDGHDDDGHDDEEQDEEHRDKGSGHDGATFRWAADTHEGAPLPFGADHVADLEGRAFEVRNAEGETVLRGEVPVAHEVGRGHDDDDGDGDHDGEHDGDGEGEDAEENHEDEHQDGEDAHEGEDDQDGEDEHAEEEQNEEEHHEEEQHEEEQHEEEEHDD